MDQSKLLPSSQINTPRMNSVQEVQPVSIKCFCWMFFILDIMMVMTGCLYTFYGFFDMVFSNHHEESKPLIFGVVVLVLFIVLIQFLVQFYGWKGYKNNQLASIYLYANVKAIDAFIVFILLFVSFTWFLWLFALTVPIALFPFIYARKLSKELNRPIV